jgi:metal-responsive CopG/Arc/MetJ family transcriptional regulator
MRTIIDLTDEQVAGLEGVCRRDKISRAAAIRKAVNALLAESMDSEEARQAAIAASAGLWKSRGINTDAYLTEIRSEWDS